MPHLGQPPRVKIEVYADMMELGSDGSAACGGRSDRSEWQRSIKSRESESPKILSGTATGRRIGF